MDENASPDGTRTRMSPDFPRAFVAAFFGYLSIFVLVHLPGYLWSRGASEAEIGAAIGIGSLAAILARPFVGRLMDARGRRPALALGGALLVLASAAHLAIQGPGPLLFVVRAVHGIAGGVMFSAVFAVASDLAPENDRTRQIAIFGIAGILPMSVGALLGDLVLARYGHRANFALSAGLAAVALGTALGIRETRPVGVVAGPTSMLAPLLDPGLRGLWVSGVLFATAVASYFTYVRNFLDTEDLATVSYFFTPYALTAILVRLAFSSLPARLGESNAVAGALVVLACGLVAIAGARGPGTVVLAGLLCGLGHAFVYPSLMTLFIVRSDAAIRGSVVAMFTALMDVGILFSGYGFGRVADDYGHRVVFAISAGLALAACLTFVATAYRPRPARTA